MSVKPPKLKGVAALMTLWTPEEDETLRTMVLDGKSYSMIAKETGRTRSGCVSRAHKIGLKGIGYIPPGAAREAELNRLRTMPVEKPSAPKIKAPAKPEPELKRVPMLKVLYSPRPGVHDDERRREPARRDGILVSMFCDEGTYIGFPADQTCRWIEGDIRDKTAMTCTEPKKPGSSYCSTHHRRVWVRPSREEQRRLAREVGGSA